MNSISENSMGFWNASHWYCTGIWLIFRLSIPFLASVSVCVSFFCAYLMVNKIWNTSMAPLVCLFRIRSQNFSLHQYSDRVLRSWMGLFLFPSFFHHHHHHDNPCGFFFYVCFISFFLQPYLYFFSTFSGLICLSLVVLCFDKKSSIKPANLVVKLKLLLWTDKKYTHFEIKFSFFSLRIRCWALLMLLLLLSLIVSGFTRSSIR